MYDKILTNPRKIASLAALLCAAALGTGLFMQHVLGFEPCSLCVLQRLAFVLALASALALLAGSGRAWWLGWSVALLGCAGLGLGVATYQVWMQAFPPAMTACSAGIGAYLDGWPFETALHWVFDAQGDCGKPTYFVGKITLAQAGFAGFVLLFAASVQLARTLVTARRAH